MEISLVGQEPPSNGEAFCLSVCLSVSLVENFLTLFARTKRKETAVHSL